MTEHRRERSTGARSRFALATLRLTSLRSVFRGREAPKMLLDAERPEWKAP